jgi:hypothetical protein
VPGYFAKRRFSPSRQGFRPDPTNSFAKMAGNRAMAEQAQSPHVVEIALPSAFFHREDVVGIPQAFSHAFLQSPVTHQGEPILTACSLQPHLLANRIDSAMGADPSISLQDLLAQIGGLGAQLPFVHAKL